MCVCGSVTMGGGIQDSGYLGRVSMHSSVVELHGAYMRCLRVTSAPILHMGWLSGD